MTRACALRAQQRERVESRVAVCSLRSHHVSQCEKSARYARTHQVAINERSSFIAIYTNCTHSTSSKQNLKILSAPCSSASSGLASHRTTSKKRGVIDSCLFFAFHKEHINKCARMQRVTHCTLTALHMPLCEFSSVLRLL